MDPLLATTFPTLLLQEEGQETSSPIIPSKAGPASLGTHFPHKDSNISVASILQEVDIMSVPEPVSQIETHLMVSATHLPQGHSNDPESMLEPEKFIYMVPENLMSTSVEPQLKEKYFLALKLSMQPGPEVQAFTPVTECDLSSPTLMDPVLYIRPELDPCCRGGSEKHTFAWEPPQIEEEPDMTSFNQKDLNELLSVLNLRPDENNGTHSEIPQSTSEPPPQNESENPSDETSEWSIPTEAGSDSRKALSDHSVRKSQDFKNPMSASAPPLPQINEQSLQKCVQANVHLLHYEFDKVATDSQTESSPVLFRPNQPEPVLLTGKTEPDLFPKSMSNVVLYFRPEPDSVTLHPDLQDKDRVFNDPHLRPPQTQPTFVPYLSPIHPYPPPSTCKCSLQTGCREPSSCLPEDINACQECLSYHPQMKPNCLQPRTSHPKLTPQPGPNHHTLTHQPGTSYSSLNPQPGTSYTSLNSQPGSNYPSLNPQPGTSYTSPNLEPGTSYTSLNIQPGTSYTSLNPQPGSNYPSLNPQPGTSYTSPNLQPGSNYPSLNPQPGTSYTSPNLQPGTSYTSLNLQPGTSFSSLNPQPGTSYTSLNLQPGTRFSSLNPQPGTSYTSLNPQPGTSYNSLNLQPGTSYTSLNPQPGTSYTSLNLQPGTSYTSLNPQPGTSYTSLNPQPGTSFRLLNHQPGTSYTSVNLQPGTSYTSLNLQPGTSYTSLTPQPGPNYPFLISQPGTSYPSLTSQSGPNYPLLTTQPQPPPPQAWYASKGYSSLGEFEKYRRWQQFRDMAKLFYPNSGPDAEALACFFIPVIQSLGLQFSSLPFIQGLHLAVGEWKKLSNCERMEFYHSAQKFMEFEERLKVIQRFQSVKGHSGAQAEITAGYPGNSRTRETDTKNTTRKNKSKDKKQRSTKHVCCPRAPLAGRLRKVDVKVVEDQTLAEYKTVREDLLHPAGIREKSEVRGQEVDKKKKEELVDGEDPFLSYLNVLCSQEEFVNEVEAVLDMQYLSDLSSDTIDLPSQDEPEVSKDQPVGLDSKDYKTHTAPEVWPSQQQTLSSTEHGAFASHVTSCDLASERHCMSKNDSIHHRSPKTLNNHNAPGHRPPVFRQNIVTQVSQGVSYITFPSPAPPSRCDLIQQATMQVGMFQFQNPCSQPSQRQNNFYDSPNQMAPLHIHTFPPIPVSPTNFNYHNTPPQQRLLVPCKSCLTEQLSPQTIPVCPPLPSNSQDGRLLFVPVGDSNPHNPSLPIPMNRTTHFRFLYHPIRNYTPSNQPSNESCCHPLRTRPVESNQIQQNACITDGPNTAWTGHSNESLPKSPPDLQGRPLSGDTVPSTSSESGELCNTYLAESRQHNYNQQRKKNYNSQPEANFNTSVPLQMSQDGIRFPILEVGEKKKTRDREESKKSSTDHVEHVKKKVLPEVGEEGTPPYIQMFNWSSPISRLTPPTLTSSPAPFPLMSNQAGRKMLTDNMPSRPFDLKFQDMFALIQSAASTPPESVCEDDVNLNWRPCSPCPFQPFHLLRESDPASVDGMEDTLGTAHNQSSSKAISSSIPRENLFQDDHLTGWLMDTSYLAGEGDRLSPPPGVPVSLRCLTEEPQTEDVILEHRSHLEMVPSDAGIGRVVETTVDGGRVSDLRNSELSDKADTETSVTNAEALFSANIALASESDNAQASDVSIRSQASGLESFSVDNSEKLELKSDIAETFPLDNTKGTSCLAHIDAADIVKGNITDTTINKDSLITDSGSGIVTANQSDSSDSERTFRPDPVTPDSCAKQFDDLSPVTIINDLNIPLLISCGTDSGSALQSNCTRKTVGEEYFRMEGTCIQPIVLQNVDDPMLERLTQTHSVPEEYAQVPLYPDAPSVNADHLQPYKHEKKRVKSCRKFIIKTEEGHTVLKNKKVGVNTMEKKLSEPVKEPEHQTENGDINKQATFCDKHVKRQSRVEDRVKHQSEETDKTLKLSPEGRAREGKAAEKGNGESSERVNRANKETEKDDNTDDEKQNEEIRKVDKEISLRMEGQGLEEKQFVNYSQGLEMEKQVQHHTTKPARRETQNEGNGTEKSGISASEATEREKKHLPKSSGPVNNVTVLGKEKEEEKPEMSRSVTKNVTRTTSKNAEGAPNRKSETNGGTDEQGVEVKMMAVASTSESTPGTTTPEKIVTSISAGFNKEAEATDPNICMGREAKLEEKVSEAKVDRTDAPSPVRKTKGKSKTAEKETTANALKELCEETHKKGIEPDMKTKQRSEEAVPVKSPTTHIRGHNKAGVTEEEQREDTKNDEEETERETQTTQFSLKPTERVEKDDAKLTRPEKLVTHMTRSVTRAREEKKTLERYKVETSKTRQDMRETPGIELPERTEMPGPITRGKLNASLTKEEVASLSRSWRNRDRKRENVTEERKEDEKEVKPASETLVMLKRTTSKGDKNKQGKNRAERGDTGSLVYEEDHEMANTRGTKETHRDGQIRDPNRQGNTKQT